MNGRGRAWAAAIPMMTRRKMRVRSISSSVIASSAVRTVEADDCAMLRASGERTDVELSPGEVTAGAATMVDA